MLINEFCGNCWLDGCKNATFASEELSGTVLCIWLSYHNTHNLPFLLQTNGKVELQSISSNFPFSLTTAQSSLPQELSGWPVLISQLKNELIHRISLKITMQ